MREEKKERLLTSPQEKAGPAGKTVNVRESISFDVVRVGAGVAELVRRHRPEAAVH
ncbi:MAG: hypothetical protein L3J67_05845 [Hyphomicrobiaceae bacterium]|nr:hypothetical protein [Hyphomicrobiaceae bacterium]